MSFRACRGISVLEGHAPSWPPTGNGRDGARPSNRTPTIRLTPRFPRRSLNLTRQTCMSWFTEDVKHPELWGLAKTCLSCGWSVSPDGPWRRIDAMFPPKRCPKCSGRLTLARKNCPACGASLPGVRLPTSVRRALWGGYTCKQCGCEIDKWGRRIAVQYPTFHRNNPFAGAVSTNAVRFFLRSNSLNCSTVSLPSPTLTSAPTIERTIL